MLNLKLNDDEVKLQEELDIEYFKMLNEKAGLGLTEIDRTKDKCWYDADAISKDGRKFIIEFKCRKENLDTNFETCFIEPGKFGKMLDKWNRRDSDEKEIPYFVNFIGDYRNTYIWRIDKLKSPIEFEKRNICGKEQIRLLLPFKDAWHYIYDEDAKRFKIIKPEN